MNQVAWLQLGRGIGLWHILVEITFVASDTGHDRSFGTESEHHNFPKRSDAARPVGRPGNLDGDGGSAGLRIVAGPPERCWRFPQPVAGQQQDRRVVEHRLLGRGRLHPRGAGGGQPHPARLARGSGLRDGSTRHRHPVGDPAPARQRRTVPGGLRLPHPQDQCHAAPPVAGGGEEFLPYQGHGGGHRDADPLGAPDQPRRPVAGRGRGRQVQPLAFRSSGFRPGPQMGPGGQQATADR